MGIVEAEFDSESELEEWVRENLHVFVNDALFIPPFRISTSSGKGGVPDGFAFDLAQLEWYVVECELLRHGVWPHIAEQITRFVVAVQNRATLRTIRDRLFEHVVEEEMLNSASSTLGVAPERFLQKCEIFIETVRPGLVIFIDETNRDLADFVHALDLPVQVYRVKKLLVDGIPQYYSPDHVPTVQTDPSEKATSSDSTLRVLEMLGGGAFIDTSSRFKCFELASGGIVHVKYSKLHERQNYYWYGINASSVDHMKECNVTDVIFILVLLSEAV